VTINIEKMGDKHQYRWDVTENVLTYLAAFVTENIENNKTNLHKFFLEEPCYATEKYDGTNIAKDEEGQIYSRKLLLEEGQEEFQKTSLQKVKEAKVAELKTKILAETDLSPNDVSKCVVYGELICNGKYNYTKRSIKLGDWKVFGALIVTKKPEENLQKLRNFGFAANINQDYDEHIQLFMNEKFAQFAKDVNLNVAETKGSDTNITKVIANNKEEMKKGSIEGLVLTIKDTRKGHLLVKWKGAQEFQPIAMEKAQKANEKIQNENVQEDLKTAFKHICEVITDISDNKKAVQNAKKTERSKQKYKTAQDQGNATLTPLDKEIIEDGIKHCQTQFDSVEAYMDKGNIENYKENLTKEVRRHLTEENTKFDKKVDDRTFNFIKTKVNGAINKQVARIEKQK